MPAVIRMRTTLAAVVAALAIAVGPWAPASPALAADDVTWGATPADNERGSGRPNFAYTAQAGETIDDGFVVTNFGTAARTFDVYAADALITDTGALDLLPASAPSKEVGAWVDITQHQVKVRPGQSMLIPFTISIPKGTPPGDYTGGVVSTLVSERNSAGIDVERRLGSRMQIRVTGALTPKLSVQHQTLSYAMTQDPFGTSQARVHYTVVNTGNARLSGAQHVTVTGPFGAFSRSVKGPDLPDLLPGSSYDVEVVVPGVRPSGFLTATIAITPELVPDDPAVSAPAASSSATTWAVPWLPVAFLVLLLAVVGFAVQRLLSRRRKPRARDTQPDETAEAAG